MDWKDIIAILIAAGLAAVGAVTGRCANELFIVSAGIVGGVFGRANNGPQQRVVRIDDRRTPHPSERVIAP